MSDALVPGPSETPKRKRTKITPAAKPKTATAKPGAARKAGNKRKKPAAEAPAPTQPVNTDERWKLIAEAAYLRAERRGFGVGDPLADWLDAEREVDERLRGA